MDVNASFARVKSILNLWAPVAFSFDEPVALSNKDESSVDVIKDSDDPVDLVKLGIKVYNSSDAPTSTTDLTIKNYSWNPKGVVLFNNNTNAGDKRIKLEISYTDLNN